MNVNQYLALLLLAAAAACGSGPAASPKPRSAELEPLPDDHPSIEPLPDPELSGGHVGRAPRRITVAQLKTSISVTTGRQWSKIDDLSASLGRADYALVNAEATEPNLVFAKFLEDGAREVCLATADADLKETDASKRVLSPEVPADAKDLSKLDDPSVRRNMVYLSTRFWGQPLAGSELDTWVSAYKGIATRAEAAKKKREAWAAICIALMTDPRFTTY
ncbi:MAG TPA: hypothetical protein VJV78_27135 [Polyangiales bacterium]|nr:hypothetical protein [Polyangiales bacterium]